MGVISHKQPVLEKHLRYVITGSKYSQLRSRCTLNAIEEDADWVYASYADNEGNNRRIRARFLVGADGKTGYVRKHYLEPRGIKMEWAEQYVFSRILPYSGYVRRCTNGQIKVSL